MFVRLSKCITTAFIATALLLAAPLPAPCATSADASAACPDKPACSVPGPCAHQNFFTRYFKQRAADFADIFRFQIALPHNPYSEGLHVRATELAQVGAVHFQGAMAGMDGRQCGVIEERRDEIGASLAYFSSVQSLPKVEKCPTGQPQYDKQFVEESGLEDAAGKHPSSLGVFVQPPALPGIDLGVNPDEAIDFVLGIVGVDLKQDDTPPAQEPAVKVAYPGETQLQNPRDFTFSRSYDAELAPYKFQPSPAMRK